MKLVLAFCIALAALIVFIVVAVVIFGLLLIPTLNLVWDKVDAAISSPKGPDTNQDYLPEMSTSSVGRSGNEARCKQSPYRVFFDNV